MEIWNIVTRQRHLGVSPSRKGTPMDNGDKTFSPPYNVPFATVLNTVEKIAADLPNKVDRSYLGSASGSVKSYLISAFKNFGLIDDDHTVTAELKALATDVDGRPEMVASLLRKHYPLAVEKGTTNATPGELDSAFAEMFPSVTGESRTKAMRFYLNAAEYAGVPRSPLWKAAKASGPRRGRPKKVTPANEPEKNTPETPRAGQSLREFTLPSGRTLTISIDGDVLALDRVERKFVMDIVDQIEEHVEQNPIKKAPKPPVPSAPPAPPKEAVDG